MRQASSELGQLSQSPSTRHLLPDQAIELSLLKKGCRDSPLQLNRGRLQIKRILVEHDVPLVLGSGTDRASSDSRGAAFLLDIKFCLGDWLQNQQTGSLISHVVCLVITSAMAFSAPPCSTVDG